MSRAGARASGASAPATGAGAPATGTGTQATGIDTRPGDAGAQPAVARAPRTATGAWPAEAGALLSVDGVDVHYGRGSRRKQAVHRADFSLAPGEVVGLIGETGSGKSTLARTIIGLVKPDAGRIVFDGRDLTGLTTAQWRAFRRSGAVQYVFQDPLRSLDPDTTLHDSVAEPLLVRGGLTRTQITEKVSEQFDRVHLDRALLRRPPGQVSGGQRQRAAIARALITEPRLLILDEPVSALDSANRVQVLELLQGLAGPRVALLFISHDLGSVAGITDRVIVLYRGQIVEMDRTDAIINRPVHPYTRLLVGSAPTLSRNGGDREWRDRLRAELGAAATA